MEVINLKKGFDIRINGEANKSIILSIDRINSYAVKPTDFRYLTPEMLVKEGDVVKAGTPLFCSKEDKRIKITSPVSGTIEAIVRGERRVIEEIRIKPTEIIDYEQFPKDDLQSLSAKEIIVRLLESGLWTFIRQRPFNTIANPDDTPKMLVISTFDTAPMAPDYDFIIHNQGKMFQLGLDVLNKISSTKIQLNVHNISTFSNEFLFAKNVEINTFAGKHPCGNVGVQIHHLSPISKGDIVWYINPQDVISIGKLFADGIYDATKIIALAGSELKNTGYHKIIAGSCIQPLIDDNLQEDSNPRCISGNVLTGKQIPKDGYIGFYDNLVSVIPEGNKYRFLGWLTPGFSKHSYWHSFFAWMSNSRKFNVDTNYNGGRRTLIFTDKFDNMLPMDIMPTQLIKACIVGDIEAMEDLGIYEVEPEDLALCEYIDPSKTEIQEIIMNAIDLIRQEC